MDSRVPDSRVRAVRDVAPRPEGDYVVYWMTSQRRTEYNYGLERAAEWAAEMGRGLVVLEALRCGYEWASDRLHRFILDGMRDNCEALGDRPGVTAYPYVERSRDQGRGLLEALSERACVVVTDDYPTFFLPRMLDAAAERLPVRLEAVDSNGLTPMRATEKDYPTAYTFRRYLQKTLPEFLAARPLRDPLEPAKSLEAPRLPVEVLERWPSAASELADGSPDLSELPLDHSVGEVELEGGARAATRHLEDFLDDRIGRYAEERNHPDDDVSSGLSPYLHFGHISAHAVLEAISTREDWNGPFEDRPANGKRSGWWGMSEGAEAFLDELVTWRELGFNMAANRPDHREYGSLPDWARETLEEHADDPREYVYDTARFEEADTHDEVWNAAQRQLRRQGTIHNYLRMLWGKKIFEWSESPRRAAEVMIHLNNRWALDGRDPNSYSGIYWCLGRYDRPWGPERPIYGKIRYMTSASTVRKLRMSEYLERYGE
jgi:deoxyribodipyrimidine photo-lyase